MDNTTTEIPMMNQTDSFKTTTITQNPVQIAPSTTVKMVKKKNKMKRFVNCTIAIVILIVLLSGTIAVLWITGWASHFICGISTEKSFVYDRLDCGTTSSSSKSFDQGNTVNIDTSKITSQEQLITDIVAQASPSVVTVAASSQFSANDLSSDPSALPTTPQDQNIGSGFIVRADGLIVTNSHVVFDTTLDYSVVLRGEKNPIPVKNIYRDSANDIAILKIDKTNLPALKLGDSDLLKQGNTVIAIGSPLGDFTGSVTTGIVSGLNRNVSAGDGTTSKSYQGVIQTDAAINPGNSGGPLLNSKGEVIGVNFATIQGASNVSFSLPINRVKVKLAEFQANGRLLQPFVGVAFTQKTYYLTDGALTGALVSQVQPKSPADVAGIKKGDLILKVNDKDLANESFQNIIQSAKVGDVLTLNIWRKGVKSDVKITVGDRTLFDTANPAG